MIDRSEQWVEGGDCNYCRRRKYCSKQCSANRRFEQGRLASLVLAASIDAYKHAAKKSYEMRKKAERGEE